jgi:putative membrane protein
MWGNGLSGFGWMGWFMNGLFIIALVMVVAGFWRSCGTTACGRKDSLDSLDILKNRLAKGEITEDEFQRIKKNL